MARRISRKIRRFDLAKTVPKGCKWYAWATNKDFSRGGVRAVDVACGSTGLQAECMRTAFKNSSSHKNANFAWHPKGVPRAISSKKLNIKVWNQKGNFLLGKCSAKRDYSQ